MQGGHPLQRRALLTLDVDISGTAWRYNKPSSHKSGRHCDWWTASGPMDAAACISHASCESGFCDEGVCRRPTKEGQPCKPGFCPEDMQCHEGHQRCRSLDFVSEKGFCRRDEDCTLGKYCQQHTHLCDPPSELGRACGPAKPCADGLQCVEGCCLRRCLTSNDCPPGDFECTKLAGLQSYQICMSGRRDARQFLHTEFYTLLGSLFILLFLMILWWARTETTSRRGIKEPCLGLATGVETSMA